MNGTLWQAPYDCWISIQRVFTSVPNSYCRNLYNNTEIMAEFIDSPNYSVSNLILKKGDWLGIYDDPSAWDALNFITINAIEFG